VDCCGLSEVGEEEEVKEKDDDDDCNNMYMEETV
jgi:hypothetical protein